LTKRLHIRHVPLLRFQEDTALAYGHRMDALLRSLNIPQEA
jgi:ribosome-binding factor A